MNKAVTKVVIALVILGLWIGSVLTASANVTKLAIIPFKVNADRDLTFLQKGIVDMLSSRLSRPGAVEVIDQRTVSSLLETITDEISEEVAREIGNRLGAEQVLFGSITAIGDAVSVDTRIVDVQAAEAARPFFVQADTMGEVIPKINRLTDDINHQVFGLEMRADTTKPAAPSPATSYRSHPEKLLTQQKQAAPSPAVSQSPFIASGEKSASGGGAFIQPIQPQAGVFWRSPTFNMHMNGLALGDVDGDGRNETVVITDHQIHMYRHEGGQFIKISESKKDRNRYFIGVDIADINANGRPEIFVTALDVRKSGVQSQVLESDGATYDIVVKKSPWYYRVSTSPGKDPVLLGQEPRQEGPYKSAVYELEWNGTDYESKGQLVPARKANALGSTVGDLRNDGGMTVAAFSASDTIQIFDDSGQLLNTSSDGYGGNMLAVNLPVSEPGGLPPIRYLPLRLIINDLNGDGQNELVVVKNKELTGKHLERFRNFTKAQIVGLSWDGTGMAEVWQTRELTGRVADYAVADLEGDGRQDLVLILVSKEGKIVATNPKANIIAYPLK